MTKRIEGRVILTPDQRFWAKVQKPAGGNAWAADRSHCWEWVAAKDKSGYGLFGISKGRQQMAHRTAYEKAIGPIPHGLQLDHLCENKGCVNPAHLEPVTPRENGRRAHVFVKAVAGAAAAKRAKTHCKRGHEFSESNLRRTSSGHRGCRACASASMRKSNERRMDRLRASKAERRDRGVCLFCDEPRVENRRSCARHLRLGLEASRRHDAKHALAGNDTKRRSA